MYCVFNKATKKFTGTALKWDVPDIQVTEVIVQLPTVPNTSVRLNNTMDGVRSATPSEVASDASTRKDEQMDGELNNLTFFLLDELITSIKDGSIATKTATQIVADARLRRKPEL